MTDTTRRVVTFNVNQFNSLKHQKADLRVRMKSADVVFVQECLHLDLVAFAKTAPGWAAFQVRDGNNDGHANTGILYRLTVGKEVTDTECVFVGDAKDTRRRFLTGVEFDHADWYESLHIFPRRDTREIAAELASVGAAVAAKVKASRTVTIGLDKNQASVASLEKATGLTWHGVGIDGFLSSEPIDSVAAFKPGFSDHDGVHGILTLPAPAAAPSPRHKKVPPPNPTYAGPAAHTSAGENKPIVRVIMHSTVSPCVLGGALKIAAYFRSQAAGGSAHYVVDPGQVVQVVHDSVIAWHAPGAAWSATSHPQPANVHSLGIEMCDMPGPLPDDRPGSALWKAAMRVWRWNRPEQQQMLTRAAKLAAQLCAAYQVPPEFLNKRALSKGRHGITTHNNVSQDFHQSTHWDPGFWPRRRFMRMVRAEYKRLTK